MLQYIKENSLFLSCSLLLMGLYVGGTVWKQIADANQLLSENKNINLPAPLHNVTPTKTFNQTTATPVSTTPTPNDALLKPKPRKPAIRYYEEGDE